MSATSRRLLLRFLLMDLLFGALALPSGAQPLGGEFRANSYTTGTQINVAVAVGSSGSFVVVWQSYYPDGSRFGIFGQRYSSAGAPLGGEFRVNSYTTFSQNYPAVA